MRTSYAKATAGQEGRERRLGLKLRLILHFITTEGTEYTEVLGLLIHYAIGGACLTWFLEFGIWSLSPFGVLNLEFKIISGVGALGRLIFCQARDCNTPT